MKSLTHRDGPDDPDKPGGQSRTCTMSYGTSRINSDQRKYDFLKQNDLGWYDLEVDWFEYNRI